VFRPDSRSLMRGQGFAAAARPAINVQDPVRTASIAKKFSNPALREIFPWWWWCCDQPNVTFGVTQAGTTIVPVDPSLDTHWCMDSGQTVTLTGNSSALTLCPGGTLPEKGYVWTSVGNILTTSIDDGGLAQGGGDNADVAFQGDQLYLYAAVASDAFKYYQVNGAVWNNLKRRGGTQPPPPGSSASAPVGSPLCLPMWIYDPVTDMIASYNVQMGPFSANGYSNLYATPQARQTLPTPPGLAPFPTIPPSGEVFWGEEGLVLVAGDTTLLGGAPFGAVDLTLVGFDQAFNPVGTEVPGGPLTLAVDSSTGLTQSVNGVTAWIAPNVPATQTGVGDCPAYALGPNGFVLISVTAQDPNGFLCEYELQAQYGHDNVLVISPPGLRGYVTNPTPAPTNPDYATATWVGGNETIMFPANPGNGEPPPDCCYEFRLYYCKRVTDGYYWPAGNLAEGQFQTISLKFSSTS
jgi:hypothetical protein